jgi:hypothetical protein
LVRNSYNYSIDYAILNAVFTCKGYLSIRRIKQVIQGDKFLNRIIPEKTFRYHFTKLLKYNFLYLPRENWRRGQRLPICLTSTTLEQIRLQTLVIRYDENKDNEDNNLDSYLKLKKHQKQSIAEIEQKRRMIYYIIFTVLSIETPNRHYGHPGLSVKDIISAHIYGHPFHYLKLEEDRSTVEECIKKLLGEKILIKTVVDGEEPRYSIAEPIWKEFVKECTKTFESVVTLRLHIIWQNIRKAKPEERLYLEYIMGQRTTDLRMKNVCTILESNRKSLGKKLLKDKTKVIESIDYNIDQLAKALRKKYHSLIEQHTWICNEIIKKQYPEFIQREVEKMRKNIKTRYKNYPKLLISVSKDAGVSD